MTPHDRSLATALQDACAQYSGNIALRGEPHGQADHLAISLTYADFLAAAQSTASALREADLEIDEPVLVRVSNHPMDFVAFFGIWLAGGVVVPVHRTAPAGVLEAIQAKAQCRIGLDLSVAPEPSACIDLLGAGCAVERPMLAAAALIIFTSGSTGLPKGAVLSHRAFAGKLRENQRLLAFTPADVTLLVLNNTFSFGLWMALLTLTQGATLLPRSRFDPNTICATLVDQRVTRIGLVPTMVRSLFGTLRPDALAAAQADIARAGCLRNAMIGGEPLGAELSARLREFLAPAGLYDIYGLTETATSDFVLTPQAYAAHPDTIGRAAAGVSYRIVDENGAPSAAGATGELQLQTPFIMAGYLGDETLTAAAFDGPWFKTGDLAVADADGYVAIVGRRKELIVRGGNKITPLEVERALCACPGVAAAMAVGLPDPVLGQRIHALLIAAPDAVLTRQAIKAALADRLEKYKHPDACYLATDLPTGRTGKIDRGQLQALLLAGALRPMP